RGAWPARSTRLINSTAQLPQLFATRDFGMSSLDESKPARGPVCIHLRSKAMYVMGQRDPENPEDIGQHCWCNLTQHIIGPDQQFAERDTCTAERDCFRETY